MKDFVKNIVIPACIYFTVLTVPFALLIYAIYGGSAESGGTLSAFRTAMSFVFALVFAAANALVRADKPSRPVRIALHAIITGLGFWLFMLMPAELEGAGELMGMLIYYIVYAIILAVLSLNRAQARRRREKEEEYKSVFKKD
ncbi:MAG: hypothetical protein IJY27_06885 [Clostridia bacterium]|nr:hypothetical protein [Clostridia bacterium]